MKRSAALRSLSRDHHRALSVALKMRRAEDAGAAARLFLSFWQTEGRIHFRVEEEVLLPSWSLLGTIDQPAIAQLAREHLEIRAGALSLAEEPVLEEVRDLGQKLADHVRFEERELFRLIELDLGEDELETLARAVADAEERQTCSSGAQLSSASP